MIKISPIIILLILFASPSAYSSEIANSARELSLKDSIGISFLNNKAIQIQEESIESAKANIVDAQGRFLPTANINGDYAYTEAILSVPASMSAGSKKDIGITTGYQNDHRLGLEVTENIYNGGANYANFKQSRLFDVCMNGIEDNSQIRVAVNMQPSR